MRIITLTFEADQQAAQENGTLSLEQKICYPLDTPRSVRAQIMQDALTKFFGMIGEHYGFEDVRIEKAPDQGFMQAVWGKMVNDDSDGMVLSQTFGYFFWTASIRG